MKKILLRIRMLIIVTVFAMSLNGQVFNGSILLATQAEVDNFNYTSVTGALQIGFAGDPTAITNVDGLSELTSVGGILVISNNQNLTNINGFTNLSSIGEYLRIDFNAGLANLNGLSALVSVGETIEISDNPALTSINFPSLTSVGDDLTIHENNSLASISISSQNLMIGRDLLIFLNPALSTLNINDLNSVGHSIDISNTSLIVFDLHDFATLGENLTIFDNASLTNIDLSNIVSVPGDLNISNNSSLTNIDLTSLVSITGGLVLSGNNNLADFTGFFNLTNIGEGLNIFMNENLANLNGLSNLSSASFIIIDGNEVLANVDGLSGITGLSSILAIRLNPLLTDLDGLSNLTSIGASGNPSIPSLLIFANQSLTNLNGLSDLTAVNGNLQIRSNEALTEFCGLYTLLNGNGLTGTYTVAFNAVNPTIQLILDGGACILVNNCPVASNSGTTVIPNGSINFQLIATDADGDALQYIITQPPSHGTVILQINTGMGTYTPDLNYCGPDEFKFKAKDPDECLSNEATVSVTMICNECPVANPLNISVMKNTLTGFQLSATDPDADPLQYSIVIVPLHGTVVINPQTGGGTYTPTVGYIGSDEFRYKVSDGNCEREALVTISIIVCPKGKGFWKNNPNAWPDGATPMMLGAVSYTKAQLINILNMSPGNGGGANASILLAHQLITAKLNIANGVVAGSVASTITHADGLLSAYAGSLPYNVKVNSTAGQSMNIDAGILGDFNDGNTTTGCSIPAVQVNSQLIVENELQSEYKFEVKAYPNPSADNFLLKVQGDTKEKITMLVMDIYGRVIETKNVNVNSILKFGEQYISGIYFVNIIQGKEQRTIKLVKIAD